MLNYLIISIVSIVVSCCMQDVSYEIQSLEVLDVGHKVEDNSLWYEKVKIPHFNSWSSTIAQHDNDIYYISESGIERYNVISEENHIFLYENDLDLLYATNDYLYYVKNTEDYEHSYFGRMTYDRSSYEQLVEISTLVDLEGIVNDFIIKGGKIYFKGGVSHFVFEYDINEKRTVFINGDMSRAAFLDDNIYFIEHAARSFSIYRQSLITNEIELVRGRGSTMVLPIDENSIYCDNVIEVNSELYYTTRLPARVYKYMNVTCGYSDEIIDCVPEYEEYTSNIFLFTDNEMLYYAYDVSEKTYLYCYNPQNSTIIWESEIEDMDLSSSFGIYDNILFYYTSGEPHMKYIKMSELLK